MNFQEFARATRLHEMAALDRAIHCLYWFKVTEHRTEISVSEISGKIVEAGLAAPNGSRLKGQLKASRRTVRGKAKNCYRLHPATEEELAASVGHLFQKASPPPTTPALPKDVPFFGEAEVMLSKQMAEIYVQIHCIENSARALIRHRLEAVHGENWWDLAASKEMKRKVMDRLALEKKNRWHQPRGGHPLQYSDFGDLKDLICNAWVNFKDIFPDQHWIASRLSDLEKSRNVIAHNNVLGDAEIRRIRLYFDDWCKQVGGQS